MQLKHDQFNKKKHLINVSYNPHKSLYVDFLEKRSDSIEQAIVDWVVMGIIMGDYNEGL